MDSTPPKSTDEKRQEKPQQDPTRASYYGERLTADEVDAIETYVRAVEASDGLDLPPMTLSHGKVPRLPYRGKVYNLRTANHQGQGKLGLTLLRLLTEHGSRARTVLYPGGAPGTNITYVARLFPDHEFYLIDPARFHLHDNRLRDTRGALVSDRIHVVQDYFTDDMARAWAEKGEPLIFVSDIRSPAARDEDFEDEVQSNMDAQMRWYEILGDCVRVAMFKFRLPYAAATVTYLAGELWLQPWAPLSSTETRLVVLGPDAPRVEYDSKIYESEMFYHNTVRREWGFYRLPDLPGGLLDVDGYDGCYDCRATVATYVEYLLRCPDLYLGTVGSSSTDAAVSTDAVDEVSESALYPHVKRLLEGQMRHLRQFLRSPPHGEHPGLPMRERRELLFAFMESSVAKHHKRIEVHEAGRRRAADRGGRKGRGGRGGRGRGRGHGH